VQAVDVSGGERLLQHADDRHDAGDRGLEAQLDAVLAGAREQLLAVLAEQLLVGGDDVAAGGHRAQHVVAGRLEAADHLDDQVRALEDVGEVALAAGQDPAQLGAQPGDRRDLRGAVPQERREGAAHGPVAEQADAKRAARGLRHRGW
jgi:hypothetical protein